MIAALLGLYLPSLLIRAKADRRQREIINGFPDALDLMLVCVEAGLGPGSRVQPGRHGNDPSHPCSPSSFGTVVLELRAGRSQEDALRRMADRAGADEIRAFATLLIQSTSWVRRSRRRCAPMPPKCANGGGCGRRKRRIACRCCCRSRW